LLGHLAAEPEQLGPLGPSERFTTRSRDGLETPTLVTHPLCERALDHRKLSGDLLHRPPGVDDAMRCVGPELQGESSSGCSHGDILPADPRVGLSGVHFRWGTSLGEVGTVDSEYDSAWSVTDDWADHALEWLDSQDSASSGWIQEGFGLGGVDSASTGSTEAYFEEYSPYTDSGANASFYYSYPDNQIALFQQFYDGTSSGGLYEYLSYEYNLSYDAYYMGDVWFGNPYSIPIQGTEQYTGNSSGICPAVEGFRGTYSGWSEDGSSDVYYYDSGMNADQETSSVAGEDVSDWDCSDSFLYGTQYYAGWYYCGF
jgi:hypothetical protein